MVSALASSEEDSGNASAIQREITSETVQHWQARKTELKRCFELLYYYRNAKMQRGDTLAGVPSHEAVW